MPNTLAVRGGHLSATDTLLVLMLVLLSAASANQAFITSRWPWRWPWRPLAVVYLVLCVGWAALAVLSFNDFSSKTHLPVVASAALISMVGLGGSVAADLLIRRSGNLMFNRNRRSSELEYVHADDLRMALMDWKRSIREVERGYGMTVDDYLNDLEVRGVLEVHRERLSEQQDVELELLDQRFAAATRELTTAELFIAGLYVPPDQWWLNRIPIRIESLEEAIDASDFEPRDR